MKRGQKFKKLITKIYNIIGFYRNDLIIIGDGAGWVVDNICHNMADYFRKEFGLRAVTVGNIPFFIFKLFKNKTIYFVNRYAYLQNGKEKDILKISKKNNLIAVWWHSDYGGNNSGLIDKLNLLKRLEPFFDFIQIPCTIEKNILASHKISQKKLVIIPEGIELGIFKSCSREKKQQLRKNLKIPQDAFCIGSFQKDGAGWDEGLEPKLEKGPDTFVKTIQELWLKYKNIFIVLTGPARGYVKKELSKIGIPFIHEYLEDYRDLASYYNLLDLYLITSRTEGGPKAVLESLASGVPLVSTKVGMAIDVIKDGENGFLADVEDVDSLVNFVQRLVNNNDLRKKIIKNGLETVKDYSWKNIAEKFYKDIYLKIKKLKINIVFEFKKGPWGGGNQFLKALRDYFKSKEVYERNPKKADVILFNSHHQLEKVARLKQKFPEKIFIHRVDGPVSLIRGEDSVRLDKTIFEANHFFASATIFQSNWSRQESRRLGMLEKDFEEVIMNAPNPTIFNSNGKIKFDKNRKIKLVASCWSSGFIKGFDIYKYLDSGLDFNKFEFTFIGNSPIKFKNIKHIKPVPPKKLAAILKENDIFITASKNDPCSNALIEALHCGLPAVSRNSGGHPEITELGGELFNGKSDIIETINKVVENYNSYKLINNHLSDINEIGKKYLDFINKVYGLQ